MSPVADKRLLKGFRPGLRTAAWYSARFFWYASGLRRLYFLFRTRGLLTPLVPFYHAALFFRSHLKDREAARAAADSPLGAECENTSHDSAIDYDRIKPIEGVSLRYYEAGAFRIGNRVSKDRIGGSSSPAAWRDELDYDDTGGGESAHDRSCCLVVPRTSASGFAMQMFHVFICLLYARSLQRRGYRISSLLLDSTRDVKSELFTSCLPGCHFPEDSEGVRRFSRLIFVPDMFSENGEHWRRVLYNCGLSNWLRQSVLEAFGIALPGPVRCVRRVTLVRRKRYTEESGKPCTDRVIENEDELIAVLESRYPGIELRAVYFEQLSIAEQLRVFTEADVLVGMHGAGMVVGTYFTPPNAGIVELFPKYYRNPLAALTCRTIAADRELHYGRWLNHRKKNEFGSDAARGIPRQKRYRRSLVSHGSLTRVPPAAAARQIDRVIRKIERHGPSSAARFNS